MKRLTAIALALAAAAAGWSQMADYASARQLVTSALQPLKLETAISIDLVGAEATGSDAVPIGLVASLEKGKVGTVDTAWLEIRVYRATELVQRIVGDGERVWSYSAARKEYVSAEYQSFENPREDYLSRLCLLSARWASQEGDFASRLLRDLMLDGADQSTRWTPWLSGVGEAHIEAGNLETDVHYRTESPFSQVTYRLVRPDENSDFALGKVIFARQQFVGTVQKATAWEATIIPGFVPNTVDYTFIPPPGVRVRAIGG